VSFFPSLTLETVVPLADTIYESLAPKRWLSGIYQEKDVEGRICAGNLARCAASPMNLKLLKLLIKFTDEISNHSFFDLLVIAPSGLWLRPVPIAFSGFTHTTRVPEEKSVIVLNSVTTEYTSKTELLSEIHKNIDANLKALIDKGLIEGISLSGVEPDHFRLTERTKPHQRSAV
jgi:hypothetical protein